MISNTSTNNLLGSGGGGYKLLKQYKDESKILASAYKMSEAYWRKVHKYLTYPVIVLTSLSSILASVDIGGVPGSTLQYTRYALLCLSFTTMILSGFNAAISPKDKESKANQSSTEFSEISSNINQFIVENNKTNNEIKTFSQLQLELLETWKSLSPPVSSEYIDKFTREIASRTRNHPATSINV
jgi:hypothetical protein